MNKKNIFVIGLGVCLVFSLSFSSIPGYALVYDSVQYKNDVTRQRDNLSAEPIWIFDSDLFIRHVDVADLNSDGTLDIIAAEYDNNYYYETSKIYAINGLTGVELWNYSIDDGARSMTLGDLTNDGVVDVIIGASKGSTTPDGRVHAINGATGTSLWIFTPGGTGDTNGDVAVGNFNGDAYLDVVVACWDDHVYAINGENGTELWSTYIGSIFINAVATGDVNNDGIDDVAFAHSYLAGFDNYQGVLNGSDGSTIWMQTVSYSVENTLLADFDGDTALEVVFGVETGSDDVEIHVHDAATGTLQWSYTIGASIASPNVFPFAYDIDGDEDLDLIVGSEYVNYYIYAFDGTNNTPLWISEQLNGYARDIAFGDVIGDGNLNIVAATYDRVQVLEVNGTKSWYYAVAGNIRSVAIGDFDADGILDVGAGGSADASGSPPDPAKSVWALRTVQSPVLWEYTFGEYGNALTIDNINNDPYLDVATVCSLDDKITVIDGYSGIELWSWVGTQNLYAVTTGDFDNNTQIDVAVAGNDDQVTALNGSDGTIMWQFTTPSDQIYRKCLQATDLNDDGNVEVIAGCDDAKVYAINGLTGNQLWSTVVGAAVNEIELADMNAAGPLDVVCGIGTGANGKKVVVLDGANGQILWTYYAPEGVEHVEVFDINNDLVPDVAAAITPYTPKEVIMIDGATHAQLWLTPLQIASNVHSMAHGDLNFDTIPDLVVQGSSTDKKVYALNGQNGAILWSFQTNGEVNTVAVADMNADGINDVIAGSDDQNVYILHGHNGSCYWSYSTADDVMHIQIADISANNMPNIACVTFGFDGVAYAFRSLPPTQNMPPYTPKNPFPSNGAQFVSLNINLSWTGGDPNPLDTVTYDVAFGTTSPPPMVVYNQTATTYDPGTLQLNNTYYWQIRAWDNYNLSTTGPVWSFSTNWNHPPNIPSSPNPANNSLNVSLNTDLSWTGGDPDNQPVTYDIFFGKSTPPPKILGNHTMTTYDPGTLDYETQYFWKIVAWDTLGKSAQSPIWQFTTLHNQPPYPPSNPDPDHGDIDVPVTAHLMWEGGDPEGHQVMYDVYLEPNDPTPDILVSENQLNTQFIPGTLNYSTKYYWQIIAEDEYGGITPGEIWEFTTIRAPKANLFVDGSLSWPEVPTGSTQTGSFTLRNLGEPNSLLDWEIRAWPDWGNWSFSAASGTDLTPDDGIVTVNVEVIAPLEKNTEFTGEIMIVNINNVSDTGSIIVSLSTPQMLADEYTMPYQIRMLRSLHR